MRIHTSTVHDRVASSLTSSSNPTRSRVTSARCMALCVRGEPSRRDQRRSLMSRYAVLDLLVLLNIALNIAVRQPNRCGLVHPELRSCSRPNFLFLEDRQNGIFIFIYIWRAGGQIPALVRASLRGLLQLQISALPCAFEHFSANFVTRSARPYGPRASTPYRSSLPSGVSRGAR